MNGTSKIIWLALGVLEGVAVAFGVVVGETLGLDVGLGVAFGSDSNPGNALVRVAGAFIDLKAIKEIKIPATSAAINRIKYNDTFFISCCLF